MGTRALRASAWTLLSVLSIEVVAAAVDSKGAAYYGGTIGSFSAAKDPVDGTLNTQLEEALVFTATSKAFRGQTFAIRYRKISDLEFGQKVGRRVGAAAATTVLLGPIGLITLFSKKKKHYLTVSFTDEYDKEQVAVLELGKDIVRTTLPIVEAKSGKKVTYQDDAKKGGG